MSKITRALISVSDKRGIVEFVEKLVGYGVEIISTGGTARLLAEKGLPVIEISDYTGYPEMLNGRVKTLHPKVHGGLLAVRDNVSHQEQMALNDIKYIDLVVVNLYPFQATIAKPDVTLAEAIENIDIGGPTMLRSAAKNYRFVSTVVDPADYQVVLDQMAANDGAVSEETNFDLARSVFRHTSVYDAAISSYLDTRTEGPYPQNMLISLQKVSDLRYGENPHQAAALYRDSNLDESQPICAALERLQGKELSFNNVIDIEAALEIAKEFDDPCAIIIKHTNPCGAALGRDPRDAYLKALETDPVSAFGSVVGFNRTVDADTATAMIENFIEAVVAPKFTPEAIAIFGKKKNIRLMQLRVPMKSPAEMSAIKSLDYKCYGGGMLVQEKDRRVVTAADLKSVAKRAPTAAEQTALLFAWKVAKHVKSNAIVYATSDRTLGVGAGQMSRVDSSKLAVMKAQSSLKGSVLASDAFFPFRDGVDAAAAAGVTAIIQPGGSMRDQEVIAACDEHGIAMVFTAIRHFKH